MGNSNVKPIEINKKSPIIDNEKIRLFIFNWNTNLIEFKDDSSKLKFLQPILFKIRNNNCNLVLLCLQQNSSLSKITNPINRIMKNLGYVMPREDGINANSSDGKLKMLLFAHTEWWGKMKRKYTNAKIIKEVSSCGTFTGRGFTILKLKLPFPFGLITFANIHNKYDADSFKKIAIEERKIWLKKIPNSDIDKRTIYRQLYQKYRIKALEDQNKCFEKLLKLIKKDDLKFVVGDLNYRIVKTNPFPLTNINKDKYLFYSHPNAVLKRVYTLLSKVETKKLKKYIDDHDELSLLKRKNLLVKEYNEGVKDMGPQFMPTCKMMIDRDIKKCRDYEYESDSRNEKFIKKSWSKKILTTLDNCYKFGHVNHRIPSWCDRILYSTKNDNISNITCLEYNSFTGSDLISKSDHIPVYGIYEIKEYGK